MKKNLLLFFTIVATVVNSQAQTAISATGVAPDASAMFDVTATNKGMLIPRVALTGTTDAATISSPAVSLLVYNTATAGGVTPGYYFNSGTTGSPVWSRLVNGNGTFPTGSGTLNYHAKWTPDGVTLGNSIAYDNGTNMGISSASPNARLDVNGPATGSGMTIRAGGGGDIVLASGGTLFFDDNYSYASGNYIRPVGGANTQGFFTAGSERMRILANGNVGIASTAPTQKLTVAGNINKSGSWIASDAVWGANTFEIHNSSWDGSTNGNYGGITGGHGYYYGGLQSGGGGGNEAASGEFYVSGKSMLMGNVGVGTTTPNEKLEIIGSVRGNIAGALRVSTGSGYIDLGPQNTSWAHLQTDRSQFYFNKQIGIDGHDFPYLDNTYDLGLSGNRWRNLYLSGTIQGPGATQFIQNQNSSAQSANFWINGTGRIGTYGIITDIPTTYGSIGLNGAKNGYYSVLMGQNTSHANMMFDGAGNGGTYYENWGWSQYYLTGSRHMQFNTSSDLGYTVGVSGSLRATSGQYLDYVNNGTLSIGGGSIGGTDAIIYAENQSNNDWGIIINKGGYDYGQDIRVGSSASYALRVVGSGSEYFRVRGDGVSYQPFIYDINNTGYYLDPNGSSYTNYFGRNYGWNWTEYDWNDAQYYEDLNNVSIMNQLRVRFIYDYDNTGYYVDPNSTSQFYYVNQYYHNTYYDAYDAYYSGQNYVGWGYAYNYYCGSYSCGWWNNSSCASYCLYNKMQVNGSAYSYGWYTWSDGRYKKNVGTISNALAMVTKMRGVTYDWKTNDARPEEVVKNADAVYTPLEDVKAMGMRSNAGFIAQELQEVLPAAVMEVEDKDSTGKVIGNHLNVNYDEVVPVLVEAIKELKKELDDLKSSMGISTSTPEKQTEYSTPAGANSMNPGKNMNDNLSVKEAIKLLEDNLKFMTKEHQEQMKDFINEIKAQDKLTPDQLYKVLEFRNNVKEFQKNSEK